MTTIRVHILHPATGRLLGACRGPTASGACPLAGEDGVVPCAGFLIAPATTADPEYWPLPVPAGYRHCDLRWNELAEAGLRGAENCRARWQAGLERERRRARVLARSRDPRYRWMTTAELEKTARWRWRLSPDAQALRRSERKYQEQAATYLAFVKFRRQAENATS